MEKGAPKKGLELSTTLGRPRKSHCSSSSSVVVPVAACMLSHDSRDPQLYRSRGPMKKATTWYVLKRKPQLYSAGKV